MKNKIYTLHLARALAKRNLAPLDTRLYGLYGLSRLLASKILTENNGLTQIVKKINGDLHTIDKIRVNQPMIRGNHISRGGENK